MLRMSEEARKAIVSVLAKFSQLIRKGDAAGLTALYEEDAIIFPPNMDMIQGGKAIKELWEMAFTEMGLKEADYTTVGVVGTGDTVASMGRYVAKTQLKGQKAMEDKGKYILLWKRTPKGWKIHWDISNSSLPPPE